ncbi:alternate-type signal peptide domain-containing protein [Nocardioides sp. CFH 31398]|uniref:alternate-type signal peptide domain-containing protein n=1 Tax=Nocardioides sp. CFH 31398 TaxID=2919579 RepID=UPI001F067CB6|nr:alternate-type signal peptide domain-containing protein [Nocardioides sp. CFH 31398]MCH1867559.1 alternate-type signal peptide domain-containing protein [Nocardioides sp. CFH 31398]
MNTHVKRGMLAGGAAFLLLGGAGSLAYWNSTDVVPGDGLDTGRLAIDASSCDAAGWLVSNEVEGVEEVAFDPATEVLVPGDVVTRSCTIAVDAEGTNLRSVFGVTGGGLGGTTLAGDDLSVVGGITRGGQQIDLGQPVELSDGDQLRASLTLAVPLKADVVDNDSMLKAIRLDEIVLTATQATTPAAG